MQFPVPADWPDQQFPPNKPESRFCCSYFPVVAAIPEACSRHLPVLSALFHVADEIPAHPKILQDVFAPIRTWHV